MKKFIIVSCDCYPKSISPSAPPGSGIHISKPYDSREETEEGLGKDFQGAALVRTTNGLEPHEYFKKHGCWSSEMEIVATVGEFTHSGAWTLLKVCELEV